MAHATPVVAGTNASLLRRAGITFRNPHVRAVAGLALLVVILFAPFLFNGQTLVYGSDSISSIDARVLYKDAVMEHGQFPFWFVSRLSGMPTLDASWGDALYPPSMAIQALFDAHRALGLKTVLHVFLAGVFFYLMLVHGFGAASLVAFAGAVFYMLNPQFVSLAYSGHEGKIFVTALVPYMVWRQKALMERPGLVSMTLLSLGVGLALLTGHVQLTYFTLWGLFFYWLFDLVQRWRRDHKPARLVGPVLWFWGAMFVGLGLSFILFYPNVMYVRDAVSVRGVDRGFDFAASWSLHWPEVFSLWVPEFAHWLEYYWSQNPFKLNTEYAGAVAGLLALGALVHKPSSLRFFWAAIALLAVLFALGANTPLFTVVYHLVPGVNRMRACSMIMFWFSFGVVLLAALFLADVHNGSLKNLTGQRRKRWEQGLLLALGVITVAALLFSIRSFAAGVAERLLPSGVFDSPMRGGGQVTRRGVFELNHEKHFVPMLWLWWLFSCTVVAALWAHLRGKCSARVFIALALVLGVIDVGRVNGGGFRGNKGFIRAKPAQPYMAIEAPIEQLLKTMAHDPFRVFSLPGTYPENGEGIRRLESVSGFHDNELRWYREFRGDQSDRHYYQGLIGHRKDGAQYLAVDRISSGNPFLNLANARYVLARDGGVLRVFENRSALGRVSFVADYLVLDSTEIVPALKSNRYSIRSAVALMEEPSFRPSPGASFVEDDENISGPAGDDARYTWKRYTPNEREVVVEAPRDGFLRISEVYYPGWKVFVNGEKTRIYRADLAWMAVALPKGTHSVVIRAGSPYLAVASLVSFPVWVVLLVFWGAHLSGHVRRSVFKK